MYRIVLSKIQIVTCYGGENAWRGGVVGGDAGWCEMVVFVTETGHPR